MSVIIKQQSEDHFLVNGKSIFKNLDGKWICRLELTPFELKIFTEHLELNKKEIK
ncbi:hypothetical protein QP519_09370 [Weeksella virosa]|uniref:hypothetical protein n=1 Tax=Weeksella virosa TaxID=1014 RepID=UPI0025540A5B|nr:hypothetical protein [Weeksella virosa]MDK7375742.1 hypothetical protein [Weeksella virosa]